MQKTQLTTTQLGDTGLEVSRVGFAAWAGVLAMPDGRC